MYSCVDDGNEFAPPGSSVVDHKFTTITETKEVLYDTYIRETNYGGGAGGIICNSGALFDGCPNTWFTVSYTNNKCSRITNYTSCPSSIVCLSDICVVQNLFSFCYSCKFVVYNT
jgi:hypothetical protein